MSSSEILFILVAALMLFGGKRLPELARSWGRVARELRRAIKRIRYETGLDMFDDPPDDWPPPPKDDP